MSDEPCEHNITGPCRICCMVEREVMAAKEDHDTIAALRLELQRARELLGLVCEAVEVDTETRGLVKVLLPRIRRALAKPGSPPAHDLETHRSRHRVGYVSMGLPCFYCTAKAGEACRDEPDKRQPGTAAVSTADVLAFPCPHCRAPVGEVCRPVTSDRTRGGICMTRLHEARDRSRPPSTDAGKACEGWCGQYWDAHEHRGEMIYQNTPTRVKATRCYCSEACRDAGRALHPRKAVTP